MKRILKMLFSAFFLLSGVYTVGNYLIAEMQIWQEAPKLETIYREEVIQYKVLRLEPREYYTVHLGTYDDLPECQEKIDELAQEGYRPFVAQELPYKIRLGCFATELDFEEIPAVFFQKGQEVHLEKCIYNQQSLRFNAENIFVAEQLAPLIVGYDVLFQHSLELLQNNNALTFSSEIWQQMTNRLRTEARELLKYLTSALAEPACPEMISTELSNLQLVTTNYIESLEGLATKQDALFIWLCQSYLLELLEQYERIITIAIE